MSLKSYLLVAVILVIGVPVRKDVPVADYHQHFLSPSIVALRSSSSGGGGTVTAKDVIELLDAAGIQRAIVLSSAYMYGSPARTVDDEYTKVKAENDWTGAQAEQYPKRFRAFCSFNPLKEYALDELTRCSKNTSLRHGIKLHFGNSDVQLENPAHLEKIQKLFRAANDNKMTIVVHMRASVSRNRPYGPIQAKIFLEQILPSVPDVAVQVAHLAGTGPGYNDPAADSALDVLAKAVENGDARTRRLWFDVATCVELNITTDKAALVAKRIRQIGVKRILYGSDVTVTANLKPKELWEAFRRLPLTDDEFRKIASNKTPYLD